jgi:hypothetical protein
MVDKKVLFEIRPSTIDGVGVFATRNIAKYSVIAEGVHANDYSYLILWDEFKNMDPLTKKKILDFCIGSPEGFIPPENNDFNKLSIEWYFNHSCNGNIGFNENGDFLAIRKIIADEEIAYDYGLAESNPRFIMKCKCGSNNCRCTITGNDWKDQKFRKKNIKIMLPRLRSKLSDY